jgi:hypothetical protein
LFNESAYRNAAKGLRRLDEWLEHGCGDDGCLQKVVDTFHPEPGELEKALAETEINHQREHDGAVREIEERERLRFKPFIWVHSTDGAHSFFSAMAERQVKVLWFQESFESLSAPAKLEVVQRRVREHYQQTSGECIGFGAIRQYQYANTFDASIALDVDGNVIEENGGRFLLPEVWLELH